MQASSKNQLAIICTLKDVVDAMPDKRAALGTIILHAHSRSCSRKPAMLLTLESGFTTHQRLAMKWCATLTAYIIAKIYLDIYIKIRLEKCRVDEKEIEQRISGSSEDLTKFEKYDAHERLGL